MNMQRRARRLPNWQRTTRFGMAGLADSQMESRVVKLMIITKVVACIVAVFFLVVSAAGQIPSMPESDQPKPKCDNQIHSIYLLGPDDQLEISGPELNDVANKPIRIEGDGDIQVPLVGRVHVAGLTVQQAEQEINKALSKYIRDPQVVVSVAEMRSQPVSILGAVNTPGVHQVQGRKTLLEMLALAGGMRGTAFASPGDWNGAVSPCRKWSLTLRVASAWPKST